MSAPALQQHAPDVTPLSVPRVASITVKLPTAVVATASGERPAEVPVRNPEPLLAKATPVTLPIALSRVVLEPQVALSVSRSHQPSQSPEKPAPIPNEKSVDPAIVSTDIRMAKGPYLERASPGEIALITAPGPIWQAQSATRAPEGRAKSRAAVMQVVQNEIRPAVVTAALRWVPLKYASAPTNIQLLNAARTQSLAARSRSRLVDRGWRKIEIGNARQVRQHSLVLYSPGRAAVALRLAAHFRCKAVKTQAVESVVVLLGRDAVSSARTSSRA
jgi:hypothetical protein